MGRAYYLVGGMVLILLAAFFLVSNNVESNNQQVTSPAQDTLSENLVISEESVSEIVNQDSSLTVMSGTYDSYSAEKVMNAKGKIVLFFHATWCPSCRALEKNIMENKEGIPAELSILKVDYDRASELKQTYGVTTQHTLVQVDNDGNLIKKWSGGSKLEALISQLE